MSKCFSMQVRGYSPELVFTYVGGLPELVFTCMKGLPVLCLAKSCVAETDRSGFEAGSPTCQGELGLSFYETGKIKPILQGLLGGILIMSPQYLVCGWCSTDAKDSF